MSDEKLCESCPHDRGGGDHDQAFRFGHVSTSSWPFPFSMREFVRLTLLKLRLRPEGVLGVLDRPDFPVHQENPWP